MSFRAPLALVAPALAGSLIASTAFAQPAPNPAAPQPERGGVAQPGPLSLSAAAAGNFYDALTEIAKQGQFAVVAEGVPLAPQLPAEAAATLTGQETPRALLGRVAAAYDYDLVPTQAPTVFLLRKRYSKPDDIPEVTLEECQQAAQDVMRLLDQYYPKQSEQEHLKGIVALLEALSPEQMKQLEAKQLRVASLTPEQRDRILNLELYLYLSNVYPLATVTELQGIGDAWLEPEGTLKNIQIRFPVGEQVRSLALPSPPAVVVVNGVAAPPADSESKPPSHVLPVREQTVSLAQLARTAAKRLPGVTLSVDEALASKRVTLFGTDAAPPDAVLRGAAQVYGLQVLRPTTKQLRLARPPAQRPRTVTELPTLVRAALPQPFVTLLQEEQIANERKDVLKLLETPVQSADEVPTRRQAVKKLDARREAIEEMANETSRAAGDLVRQAWQKHKQAGTEKVPLSALDARERNALATVVGVTFAVTIRDRMRPVPPANLLRFNEVVLSGGFKGQGKERQASLRLQVFNAGDTTPRDMVGASGIPAPVND